jgi:hypothetical protein
MLKAMRNPVVGSEKILLKLRPRRAKCKLTCQNREQEQVLGVRDDSLVPEIAEHVAVALFEGWGRVADPVQVLVAQTFSLQTS